MIHNSKILLPTFTFHNFHLASSTANRANSPPIEAANANSSESRPNNTMNLTVKTLKGSKFTIECEPSNTVAEVKTVIVSSYEKI